MAIYRRPLLGAGILLGVWLTCCLTGCAVIGTLPLVNPLISVPKNEKAAIEQRLSWAGDNQKEILTYLKAVPAAEQASARFMIANLPPRDLGLITGQQLLTNHQLAFRARSEFAWGAAISDDLFLHYVLPYHISQEALQPWRQQLYEEVVKALSGITDIETAALELNKWTATHLKFEQTEFRDQGPLTSLKHGVGRCEELMILYIAVARIACIPARACSTPWWALMDNNHAWVEVWANGKWYYIDAGGAQAQLSDTWFSGAAKNAMMVKSVAFGALEESGSTEIVCNTGEDYSMINSTRTYTETGEIEVTVLKEGAPAFDIPVYIYVFNYGAFRPVTRINTDASGISRFTTGVGDVVITAGDNTLKAMQTATVKAGHKTIVNLSLTEHIQPPESLWLHYPNRK